jgi:DNA-binding NarL/FixJ family response regulator
MENVLTAIENIMYLQENSPAAKKYKLTREEYLVLYAVSKGYNMNQIIDYLGRSMSSAYRIRKKIIKKFSVTTFNQVVWEFSKIEFSDKELNKKLK